MSAERRRFRVCRLLPVVILAKAAVQMPNRARLHRLATLAALALPLALGWPLDASAQDTGLPEPAASAGPDPGIVPDPAAGFPGDPSETVIAPGDGLRPSSSDPLLDQAASSDAETGLTPDPSDPADDDFQAPSQIVPEEPAETPPAPEPTLLPEPVGDAPDPSVAEPDPAAQDSDAEPVDVPVPPTDVAEPEPQPGIVVAPPPPADLSEEEDPYAPLGYKLGAFRLYPSIDADIAYSDNVFKSQGFRRSDSALVLRPSLSLQSQWERHDLELLLDAERSFHRTFDSENDENVDAELRGRLDITSITNVETDLGYSFDQLERGTIDGSTGLAPRLNVRETRAGATLNQRLNHFTLKLRGVVTNTDEMTPKLTVDPALCDDSNPNPPPECDVIGQDYQDRQLAFRLGYELYEGLEVFADGDRHWRRFASLGGTPLGTDSHGVTLRGGIMAELGPVWRGFIAAGFAEETPEDRRLPSLRGAIAEAQVVWTPSALTTVTFDASRGITTTTITDSAGSFDTAASVEVRHELRRYLALLAGFDYERRDFSGIDEVETTRTFHLGVEYDINRALALTADYRYIDVDSNADDASYNENQFRIGVTAQR